MNLKSCIGVVLAMAIISSCNAPVNFTDYEACTIYRDQWGVPHIHGETDAAASYGLAWASSEDDFQTIQEQLLAIKGLYGEVIGRDGIVADIAIKYMGILGYAEAHIHELDEPTLAIIDGYVEGVTAYAKAYPDELLHDDFLPLDRHHVVAGYMLGLVEISGASKDLSKLVDGSIVSDLQTDQEKGSNAIAVSASKTEEGQTFLAINSHQPMEGWYSWYEAHLISDEGLNILGGTFPGAATIFHGTNENLGWAHTVNHADFSDVYKLTMHPTKEDHYLFDGEYIPLEKKSLRSWVKVFGPLEIPVSRKIYESKFGITFKVDDEYYAWRYQAQEAVTSIQQWFQMSKATNFEEWKNAVSEISIPCTNIVYADREDNIFYVSNGLQPIRNENYNWKKVVPAESSDVLWNDQFWSFDSLPQVLNPPSGFVFNTNNTPFSSSADTDDPRFEKRYVHMGFLEPGTENNRSLRFQSLMDTVGKLSYEEFLDIKYDYTYPTPLMTSFFEQEPLLKQDPKVHQHLTEAITALNKWDRRTNIENKTAPLFLIAKEHLRQAHLANITMDEAMYISAIEKASDELVSKYGTISVPLGDFQRHRRGDVDLPIPGGSDVLAAIYAREDEDGKYRAYSGESYIQLVRFDSLSLPLIESVHAYGASARPESPHYTDQMEMFVNQERKVMSLDLATVKAEAVRSYHPKKIDF